MAFTSVIQIIKVNELRKGAKDGRPWEMQDAECLLLDEEGKPSQVGVLMLPKELRGNVTAGIYAGTFALSASLLIFAACLPAFFATNAAPFGVSRP